MKMNEISTKKKFLYIVNLLKKKNKKKIMYKTGKTYYAKSIECHESYKGFGLLTSTTNTSKVNEIL